MEAKKKRNEKNWFDAPKSEIKLHYFYFALNFIFEKLPKN